MIASGALRDPIRSKAPLAGEKKNVVYTHSR